MWKRVVIAGLVSVAVGYSAELFACGDKYLVPSRGARFQQPVDRESGAILLYGRTGGELSATLTNAPVELMLRKAGYRPTIVLTPEEFSEALNRGGWDVVVLDLNDGSAIASAGAASSLVLPVAENVSRAAFDAARKQYGQVLKSPRKPQAFLDVIDKVIVARAKAREKAARARS